MAYKHDYSTRIRRNGAVQMLICILRASVNHSNGQAVEWDSGIHHPNTSNTGKRSIADVWESFLSSQELCSDVRNDGGMQETSPAAETEAAVQVEKSWAGLKSCS